MRLHFIIDVSPEEGVRPAVSDAVIDATEPEIEQLSIEVKDEVYSVRVLGVGKSAEAAQQSWNMRRSGRRR